jgi:BirA family biotin operon repressor/biotin-[acetyl-CoA-carboxylase] ligase
MAHEGPQFNQRTRPPDPITPEAVRTDYTPNIFGRRILYYESVDSTNNTLREAAGRGEPEGTVVLANEQTAGRGRLNRTWVSPAGVGIYMSLLLRPDISGIPLFLYTFLPAVAAARALRRTSGLPVFIHWPNDLTLRGRKLAGILTDIRSSRGHPRDVIIGIGINVNQMPADLPAELTETATSLAMTAGRRYSRAGIIQALLEELERGYALLRAGKLVEIVEAWRKLSPSHQGAPVEVVGGSGKSFRGTTRGIDDDGALLIQCPDGGLERVAFGEIRRVRGGKRHAPGS